MIKIHTIDVHFMDRAKVIACYLVETEAGPVLVETGPHSTLPHLEKGIQAIGYQLKDIQHVFLTHIHLDHAGCAWYFAALGAQVYVHPRGLPHLEAPERLMKSARMIYKDRMDLLWGEMRAILPERLTEIAHGQVINIGGVAFRGWYTPGHAIHHIAWQVDKKLFTGDVAGVKVSQNIVTPPCPPPDIDLEAWGASIQLMKDLDLDELFLGHYGSIKGVDRHLEALENILWDWANWVKPHAFDPNLDQAKLSHAFKIYVENQLREAGITTKEGIALYESANPSWMSLVGLLRYWRKRGIKIE